MGTNNTNTNNITVAPQTLPLNTIGSHNKTGRDQVINTISGNTIKGNNNTVVINNYHSENQYLKEQNRLLKQLVKSQKTIINQLKKNQNERI